MRKPIFRHGFTLIELLVVVTIIVLLIAILLPSLGRARDVSKRTVCLANQKSIAQGFRIYAEEHNVFPTGSRQNARDRGDWLASTSGANTYYLPWAVIYFSGSFNHNPKVLYCPSRPDTDSSSLARQTARWGTSWTTFFGTARVSYNMWGRPDGISSITNGPGVTPAGAPVNQTAGIVVGQSSPLNNPAAWIAPYPKLKNFDNNAIFFDLFNWSMGYGTGRLNLGIHERFINVGYTDGSAQMVDVNNFDPAVTQLWYNWAILSNNGATTNAATQAARYSALDAMFLMFDRRP